MRECATKAVWTLASCVNPEGSVTKGKENGLNMSEIGPEGEDGDGGGGGGRGGEQNGRQAGEEKRDKGRWSYIEGKRHGGE